MHIDINLKFVYLPFNYLYYNCDVNPQPIPIKLNPYHKKNIQHFFIIDLKLRYLQFEFIENCSLCIHNKSRLQVLAAIN